MHSHFFSLRSIHTFSKRTILAETTLIFCCFCGCSWYICSSYQHHNDFLCRFDYSWFRFAWHKRGGKREKEKRERRVTGFSGWSRDPHHRHHQTRFGSALITFLHPPWLFWSLPVIRSSPFPYSLHSDDWWWCILTMMVTLMTSSYCKGNLASLIL